MTNDERLAKLKEQHEALVAMQQATQKRIAELVEAKKQDTEKIRALLRIAETHAPRHPGPQGSADA